MSTCKQNYHNEDQYLRSKFQNYINEDKPIYQKTYSYLYQLIIIFMIYIQYTLLNFDYDIYSDTKILKNIHTQNNTTNHSEQKVQNPILNMNNILSCIDALALKRDIPIKTLFENVQNFSNQMIQQGKQKKEKLLKQIQNEQKYELSNQEIKDLFSKREIEYIESEISESEDISIINNDSYQFEYVSSILSRNQNYHKKQQQNEKYQHKGISNIDRVFQRSFPWFPCLIEYYKQNEQYLTFEEIQLCELIEYEYYSLKLNEKTSLYGLMINFYNLLVQIENNKQDTSQQNIKQHSIFFDTQDNNQQNYQIVIAKIYNLSKIILDDLYNILQQLPELFEYEDPDIQEIIEIADSFPMEQVILNLVDIWQNNWEELGLKDSSHQSIKESQSQSEYQNDKSQFK